MRIGRNCAGVRTSGSATLNMLLTISTTHEPATDLGYLLHKHPDRLQEFDLSFGKAHVFYPEASEGLCTAALQLQIDPIGLLRRGKNLLAQHYVNDRPYVASSLLSVALNSVFRSALAGNCADRPKLAQSEIPLEARVYCLPCPEGETLLRRLFEPLDYKVCATPHPLEGFKEGEGICPYFSVTVSGVKRLRDLLRHLYVLIPVLDKEKHYWVGDDEVDKLLRHGADWLEAHPEREFIVSRYLKSQQGLTRVALQRLGISEQDTDTRVQGEELLEKPIRLGELRRNAIKEAVRASGASSVLDLGCGEGGLIKALLEVSNVKKIVGVDVSSSMLARARRRLRLDEMPENQRQRIRLMSGSVTYRDARFSGFDMAIAAEVIEHIDLDRLGAFERSIFEFARPRVVMVTTPNVEYNAKFPALAAGEMRHLDHRFEWTRAEFAAWCTRVGEQYGYSPELGGIGDLDPELGAPTQFVVFRSSAG